jgi:arylsulfatase A-like enzyme
LAAGRSYDRCGVPDNQTDYPLDQPTYYRALRDKGYRVAGVGKFDLHKATLDWNLDGSRLIQEWGFTEGIDSEGKPDGSRSFVQNGGPKGPHNPMDVTASMRQRWAEVPFPLPHKNDKVDREGLLRNRQNYGAMIENIDRQVVRFVDQVEEQGESEDTMIVYASDHGEMLGDHNRWGKTMWYDASAGVPLIVAGPGTQRGVVSTALVSLQDLTATFLDYAQAPALPGMEAISLRPLLEGTQTEHREYVVSGYGDWRMVFDGRFKLVDRTGQAPLLYDVQMDPWEDTDVAGQEPDIVARLQMAMVKNVTGR